jgi:hypothetical protein
MRYVPVSPPEDQMYKRYVPIIRPQQMLASGLITRLPDPAQDIDDDGPDDLPVPIEGGPLSETIIRERR